LALGLLVALPAGAGTIYRWTDEAGVPHYGDTAPPDRSYQALPVEDAPAAHRPSEGGEAQSGEKAGADTGPDRSTRLERTRRRVRELAQQVAAARRRFEQARRDRREGEAVRYGSEQNYRRYLERIQGLRVREAKARQRWADLRQQLKQARQRLAELRKPE
jgi:hypothetical protein